MDEEIKSLGVAGKMQGQGPLAARNPIDPAIAAAVPEAEILPPIQAAGTLTKTQIIFIIGQAVAALAGVVGFLGLGETSWIVKAVRFLQSNDAVPLISVFAWAVMMIVLWFRNRRRAIERAVMAAMLPSSVAELKGAPAPVVQAAITAAVDAQFRAADKQGEVKGL